MSEYAGRIAVGAVLAVAIAVGLGFELSTYVPNSASTSAPVTSTTSTSFTCTGGSYRGMTWMMIYNLTDGRIHTIAAPCNAFDAQNGMGLIDVTSSSVLHVILTNGWANAFYVNLTTKQITQIPGVTFSSDNKTAFYNGQPLTNGTMLATPYTSPSTIIRNIPTCLFLNGETHVAYPPLQSGPIFLKVVTDQGSVVTNGIVYASHRLSPSVWHGSGDYCLAMSLDTNSSGYMQAADPAVMMDGGDGLPIGGVYNYTVVAQYGTNQTFRVAIPDIVVQPNATTYITISIPSGEVTTVTTTCTQESSCTQSTSTTSAKGG